MLWTVCLILAMTTVRMSLSVAERRVPAPSRVARTTGEFLEVGIVALTVVFLVIRPFVAQAFYIPSSSMRPTLREDDRIIVNKLSYWLGQPARHDVVVFRAPREALAAESGGANGAAAASESAGEETDYIKRVIGLPGDLIEVHHGVVYVNGQAQSEPYCREQPYYELAPYVVPAGKLFVMGDNRNHSNDSHRWGALDKRRLVGRAVCIFWPPSRAGAIR
jgi:signal peptidase I